MHIKYLTLGDCLNMIMHLTTHYQIFTGFQADFSEIAGQTDIHAKVITGTNVHISKGIFNSENAY